MNKKLMTVFSACAAAILLVYYARTMADAPLGKKSSVYEKLAAGQNLNYLVIGDSIGRGSGAPRWADRWFSQLEKRISHSYHLKMKRHLLVQSGSTAFEGLYKLHKSSFSDPMDIVFIFFGENDRKYMDSNQFSIFYESLIRHTKRLYPQAEIFTITENPLQQEEFAEAIKTISHHYQAKNIDMRIPFEESGLLTEQLTVDQIHPNEKGYAIYAGKISETIEKNLKNHSDVAAMKRPLNPYTDFKLKTILKAIKQTGFQQDRGLLISGKPGDTVEFEFSGPFVGVNVINHQQGGAIKVYIDGEYVRTLSTWWPLSKERHLYVASQLKNGPHKIKFTVAEEKSPHSPGQGMFVQISGIVAADLDENKKME